MNADLDTLATALYVEIDDVLKIHPDWAPERPAVGIPPNPRSDPKRHFGCAAGVVGVHL